MLAWLYNSRFVFAWEQSVRICSIAAPCWCLPNNCTVARWTGRTICLCIAFTHHQFTGSKVCLPCTGLDPLGIITSITRKIPARCLPTDCTMARWTGRSVCLHIAFVTPPVLLDRRCVFAVYRTWPVGIYNFHTEKDTRWVPPDRLHRG